MSDALQLAVIDALRAAAPPVTLAELRKVLSETLVINSIAPIAAAVQSLRYQGKVAWERLELSPSMVAQGGGEEPPKQSAGAPPAVEGGGDGNSANFVNAPPPSNQSGPDDDEEDYPGGVNDVERGIVEPPVPAEVPEPEWKQGFRKAGTAGGHHAQATRAYGKPPPAPAHEPEIARVIREEASESVLRRHQARSTATVRQPIELRKFGVPEMNLTEALSSMLSQEPQTIMRAVSRKHPAMWRRVIYLARALGQVPMVTLYAALERGLEAMEAEALEQEKAA